jgi:hypothetical protein
LAQAPRVLHVTHHSHAPATVLRATDLGVPALALIQMPEHIVVSNVIRHPQRTSRALADRPEQIYASLARAEAGTPGP